MTYESRLKDISQDVSLNSSSALYYSTSQNVISDFPDPTTVKEELAHLKEFSSKLKFQYLEQETRDKFLRLMLMEKDQNISQKDIEELVEQNAKEKKALKQLKTEMYSLIKTSEAQAEENISLNRSFEARNLDISNTLLEIDTLKEELETLLNDPENENHKTLFNLKKIIDTEDIGLNEAISIATNALDQDVLTLSKLDHSVEKAQADLQDKSQLLVTLEDNLKKLDTVLKEIESKPKEEQEPRQVFAQWLRDMNTTLQKFIPVSLQFTESAQILKLGSHLFTFDEEFNIISCSDKRVKQPSIQQVNSAKENNKFWKLLQLLTKVIFSAEQEVVGKKEVRLSILS